MLKKYFTLILFLLLVYFPSDLIAQPPPPPDPDPVPIDGGIALLLAIGIGYGIKKLRKEE